ncbi:hypothetical protein PYCCODRAFT_1400633 [Trametes coccinea BRFM310]|uniref:Protein kinase domain-containing protein n=1 Tax=Trametes coccinea (strain BRFM310) TaxID=1353009 RepID=A0A1Y2J748_TRAC3|nr:hypothetical protein PYCCODRAFT_1400633 [Trametes coccinea BRFM310]
MENQQSAATESSTDLMLIRRLLPETLPLWRQPPEGTDEAEDAIWTALYPFFVEQGYEYWKRDYRSAFISSPILRGDEVASGFAYVTQHRAVTPIQPGSLSGIFELYTMNPLCHPARTKDRRDVVIRVLAVGERGKDHVQILHTMAQGSLAFCSNNHTIPLFDTIDFADITFGVFPKVGFRVADAYGFWAQNSVGDIIDMLRQCLEALAFLEAAGVAHRDAFKDNFLIQWHPESLRAGHSPHSLPRVYLTDFEVAIKFPDEATYEECVASGIPTGGSFPDDTAGYKRPVPPEMGSGEPYNALKMDIWQLAKSFEDFKSTIPQIDELLEAMRDPKSSRRPASSLALSYLAEVLSSMPPKALFIAPVFIQTNYGVVTPPPGA